MKDRPDVDVSQLPAYAFGHRSVFWWGVASFMLIEGAMLAVLLVSYFYLLDKVAEWPPNTPPPNLIYGSINTLVLLASIAPNYIYKKAAEREDLSKVRTWLLISIVFGVVFIIIRWLEFSGLNCGWDTNAYGSVVWVTLGVHTAHLVTDFLDTIVLAALLFTRPLEGKRFVDVSENAFYWFFVVLIWIPVYGVIYLVPYLI